MVSLILATNLGERISYVKAAPIRHVRKCQALAVAAEATATQIEDKFIARNLTAFKDTPTTGRCAIFYDYHFRTFAGAWLSSRSAYVDRIMVAWAHGCMATWWFSQSFLVFLCMGGSFTIQDRHLFSYHDCPAWQQAGMHAMHQVLS